MRIPLVMRPGKSDPVCLSNRILLSFTFFFLLLTSFPVRAAQPDAPLLNSYVYNCNEQGSYGLYSYYILSQAPYSRAMDSAIEHTIFILTKIRRLNRKIRFVPDAERNVIYIPVSQPTQGWMQDPKPESLNAAARWILRYYDYDCAQKILANSGYVTDPARKPGPLLVSSLYKLAPDRAFHTVTLTQNFSNIEPIAGKYLLSTFFRKTWYRRNWNESRLIQLGNTMQDTLNLYFAHDAEPGNLADPVSDVDVAEDEAAGVFIPFIHDPVSEQDTDTEQTVAPTPDINIAELNARRADADLSEDSTARSTEINTTNGFIYIHRP